MIKSLMIKQWLARVRQTLCLMIGLPDYEAYLQHHREQHPGTAALSYKAFFREAQRRRYDGGRGGRCC